MNNGSIWGHGGMLGPDFSAQTLHNIGLFLAERIAQERFGRAYSNLDVRQKGTVDGDVAVVAKTNRYDPASGTLTLPVGNKAAFDEELRYWKRTRQQRRASPGGGSRR
jgi:nitric oxide reductase subunit B